MAANSDRPTALLASPAEAAQSAEACFASATISCRWRRPSRSSRWAATAFLLQTLHEMLHRKRICPLFGMNRGTVGFLMNDWRIDGLRERVNNAKVFSVAPLKMVQ
jgi:NAD+ kinase